MAILEEEVEINNKTQEQETQINANTVGLTVFVITSVVIVEQRQMAIKMKLQKKIGWVVVSKTYH